MSDIKEVITFYDQRMIPSTLKPATAAAGVAPMEGVVEEETKGEEEKTMGWAKSEDYWFPATQGFSQNGAKVVVSPDVTSSPLLVTVRLTHSVFAGLRHWLFRDGRGHPRRARFGSGSVSVVQVALEGAPAEAGPCIVRLCGSSRNDQRAGGGQVGTVRPFGPLPPRLVVELTFLLACRFIATAGIDAIVNLWDADGLVGLKSYGEMTFVLRFLRRGVSPRSFRLTSFGLYVRHSGEIRNLSFSHDGELIAAGGGEEKAVYIVGRLLLLSPSLPPARFTNRLSLRLQFSTATESLVHKVPTAASTVSISWSPKADVSTRVSFIPVPPPQACSSASRLRSAASSLQILIYACQEVSSSGVINILSAF